ncbi:methyltransferase domain-containing protein [Caproiciproducens sp. LBM24188]
MLDWNAAQYLKFSRERTLPAIDLANRIPAVPKECPLKIIDIGCGPGNSTQVLADRFPGSSVLGVDRSENMIESARNQHPGITFQTADIPHDLPTLDQDYDVVFSNACIQWIPNHAELLRGLMSLLKPGGFLAVQTPMNHQEPIHQIIQEVTSSDEWKGYFPNPRVFYNLTQEEYFDLLSELSQDFDLWQTTYFHTMRSHRDILEWYRSTGLKPYLDVLPENKKSQFEQVIQKRVEKSYLPQKNGTILFRFPRFFFLASKPASI